MSAVDLRALECFVAVAEAGTVTAGAEALGVGQPAVTRQLQQLERRLRLRLFHREGGRVRLTAAGRELLDPARQALGRVDDVATTARALAAGRLQEVRIAATSTTSDDILAPWIATWDSDAPLPAIEESPVDGLAAALHAGADLAVMPIAPPPGLAVRTVTELPVWACVAADHPWASRESVPIEELAVADLLLLPRTFHARRRLDAALEAAGLAVDPLAVVGSPVVAQALAASGRGVCVLTDDPRFGLVPLTIQNPGGAPVTIRLHVAWEPGHHAADTLSALADDLARFTRARYRTDPTQESA
ncbi:LysR family transcriptional regulator [Mobilicoccus pelagius]|uniref:Putative LysR family transcriptional regulator n=1 Tax=Mobilicoccus pelagius NBRC 104925 TaxID=1089455 RepID=H5URD6_9MICO|nr:LysR family transcriptional regulator [Mobilicoccus pelagius]GAB48294.1 putative LysR family transcriptional regulator [Mobilicoccus pelagius NBRC 104925]